MMTVVLEESRPAHAAARYYAAPTAAALVAILRQLSTLLESLTDEQYARQPVGVVPSSVGGHVRHCLDHVATLFAGAESGAIDYDGRARGTDVERCRRAALAALGRLERPIMALADLAPSTPLLLQFSPSSDGSAVDVRTSLGRELAFVLSHTIHHNALIGVMARLLGIAVPERFGYAPSTIAYLEQRACAR